ncbi:MAG: PorT family protein [Sphingobacteriales bacterium JAD_PAG50586_3]|nr:MAG: PorT family protein [Sphingobacteriales bacterium JAD_PAG50586_3]
MKSFLVTLCVLVGLSLSAQSRFGGGFGFGFTTSQVSGDNLSGFNRPGPFGGFFGNYAFNDRNWLQFEINFIGKGSYKGPKKDDNTKYSLNLNYVEVPVLYRFMPWGSRFLFELGPTFGYLINYTERSELGDLNQPLTFKKLEVGVLAGINYKVGNGWLVNFRFQQSVLPVRDHQGSVDFRLNAGQYNTLLCLNLRYDFGLRATE